jgi:hypothetical protein
MDAAPAKLAELKAKLKLGEALHSGDLKALSQRELRALTGEWNKEAVAPNEDDPSSYEGWDAYRDDLLAAQTFPDCNPGAVLRARPEGTGGSGSAQAVERQGHRGP